MPSTAQMLAHRLGGGTAVALALVLGSGIANAQSTSAERIDAIERQIRNLQNQVQQLKGELDRSRSDARQSREAAARARQDAVAATAARNQAAEAAARTQAIATAAPPPAPPPEPAKPGPKVVQTSGNRFGLESADGRNAIYLTGRLHFDMGDYMDFAPQSARYSAVQKLNSGVNARRARIGVTGKFAGDWDYSLIFDFGGSSDTGNPSALQSALVTYNGLKKIGVPLAFDLGYMDTPFTLQEATSSNDLLFVERASIQTVATSLFAGDFRSAVGARSNDDRYWVGVYGTGPVSGASHTTPEAFGAFGRAAYQVLQGEDYSVHLGGDAGALLKAPESGGIATVTLSDRPELRVDPTAILSTGRSAPPQTRSPALRYTGPKLPPRGAICSSRASITRSTSTAAGCRATASRGFMSREAGSPAASGAGTTRRQEPMQARCPSIRSNRGTTITASVPGRWRPATARSISTAASIPVSPCPAGSAAAVRPCMRRV